MSETPRTLVRPLAATDADALLELSHASRELHRPWAFPPSTRMEVDDLLARGASGEVVTLVVVRASDRALAGVFNFSQIFMRNFQSAYLGYYAHARLAGQGYMTEGMAAALRHAFAVIGLHRVEANIQPGNSASIALVRRAGFRREGFSPRYLRIGGEWRDHERWAMLAEDWRAPTHPSRSQSGQSGASAQR